MVIVGWNDTSASVTGGHRHQGQRLQQGHRPHRQPRGALPVHLLRVEHHRRQRGWEHRHRHLLTVGGLRGHPRPRVQRGLAHQPCWTRPRARPETAPPAAAAASPPPPPATSWSAGNMVSTLTHGPATGWTLRFVTSPDGDLAEDRVATTAGAYTGSAPLDGAGTWVMQTVAFKARPARHHAAQCDCRPRRPPGRPLSGTVSVTVTANDPDSGLQASLAPGGWRDGGTPAEHQPGDLLAQHRQVHQRRRTPSAPAPSTGCAPPATPPPVSVTFSNASAGNPAVTGLVSPLTTLPIIVVHTSQLPDSRLLISGGPVPR